MWHKQRGEMGVFEIVQCPSNLLCKILERSFVLSVIWQAAYVNTSGVETVHCVAWNSADLFCRPCPAELSWSVNHAVHI